MPSITAIGLRCRPRDTVLLLLRAREEPGRFREGAGYYFLRDTVVLDIYETGVLEPVSHGPADRELVIVTAVEEGREVDKLPKARLACLIFRRLGVAILTGMKRESSETAVPAAAAAMLVGSNGDAVGCPDGAHWEVEAIYGPALVVRHQCVGRWCYVLGESGRRDLVLLRC